MPEPTFLQIQGGGDSTTRMIELPLGPVRIGRGPHCEVRLGDAGLGDVHCMLRRRGATWHFQPVGPAGHVWIDGRPVDQQRPIPLGVPFRVGEHWLVLRPADSATNDWGSFNTPITIEPLVEGGPEPTQATASPSAAEPVDEQARPRPNPGSDDNEERLRRWEARLEQRERWLKDRQEERRWEARWKSAGETIRAKTTPPAAGPASPPRSTPTPPPTSGLRAQPSRPSQTPPVARIIEPRGSEPIRRPAEPAPRPSTPRVVVRPLPDPPAPIRRPATPGRSLVALRPASEPVAIPAEAPPEVALELATVEVDRPEAVIVEEIAVSELIEADVDPESSEIHPATIDPTPQPSSASWGGVGRRPAPARERIPRHFPSVAKGPSASPLPLGKGPVAKGAGSPEAPGRAELALPMMQDRQGEPYPTGEAVPDGCQQSDLDPIPLAEGGRESTLIESSSWLEETLPIAIEEARLAEIAPIEADRSSPGPEIARPVRPEPPATDSPGELAPSRGDLPSARAIFAAQGRRGLPEPDASRPTRRKAAHPEPTDARTPATWSMPLWLGWFPVLVVSLMVGLGGIALACEWAIESNNANFAIRMAERPQGAPGSTIDPALIPRGGWWTSTATHQAAWAMSLIRAADGEDHSEEIRSLLDSAGNASKLAARSRFVVEVNDPAAAGSTPDLSHLGRTRDVVTLVWTGRRLRKEGKLDSAIRAYRSAMEIASKASLEDLDPPAFFEDPRVRRYALPRESLLGFVAKAMAEDGEWTVEQWLSALPPSAAASMAASRVFDRMQKRPDADRLADLAIRQAESPTPPGYDPAEDRAAGAEALAYRLRWPEAAEQYRRAIDQAEDDATRRMWWLNLAEVAQRMDDEPGRARAIEAAKSPSSIDDITRRALKYQQSLPGLVSSGPRP